MPPAKRAKIFSMYDALKGFKEALAAKEIIPEERKFLAEDRIEELNRTLLDLRKGSTVTVVLPSDHRTGYQTGFLLEVSSDRGSVH